MQIMESTFMKNHYCWLNRNFIIFLISSTILELINEQTVNLIPQVVAIKLRTATGPLLSLGQQTEIWFNFFQLLTVMAEQPSNLMLL